MSPFGVDFESTETDKVDRSHDKDWHAVASGGTHARWLALIELQHENFAYDNSRNKLPMTHPLLRQAIHDSRERRRANSERRLINSPEDLVDLLLASISTDMQKVWLVQFCSSMRYRSKQLFVRFADGDSEKSWLELSRKFVERIADQFFQFVNRVNLHASLQSVDSLQLVVMAIFHARLMVKPKQKQKIGSDASFAYPVPLYVSASSVESPEVPYFMDVAQMVDPKQTRIEAPRVCQLCGVGCLDWQSLFKHCSKCHHSYTEARKRLLFHAEEDVDGLPLRHRRKRTVLDIPKIYFLMIFLIFKC